MHQINWQLVLFYIVAGKVVYFEFSLLDISWC